MNYRVEYARTDGESYWDVPEGATPNFDREGWIEFTDSDRIVHALFQASCVISITRVDDLKKKAVAA